MFKQLLQIMAIKKIISIKTSFIKTRILIKRVIIPNSYDFLRDVNLFFLRSTFFFDSASCLDNNKIIMSAYINNI